jgi:hypothetical protein
MDDRNFCQRIYENLSLSKGRGPYDHDLSKNVDVASYMWDHDADVAPYMWAHDANVAADNVGLIVVTLMLTSGARHS